MHACLEKFGRLGCARDNQPYVMPVYFAYSAKYLYGVATVGQRIEWMRANPLVCVEVDEISGPQQWKTVIVFGRYEEMPDTPEWQRERVRAHGLLQQRAMWWQPAYVASTHSGVEHSLEPVFYRVRVDRFTGRRATPDPQDDEVYGLDVRADDGQGTPRTIIESTHRHDYPFGGHSGG